MLRLSVCLSVPCSCSKRYILGLWLPTIETPCWKSNRLGNTAVRPPEVSETGKGAYRFTAIGAITCCRAPGAECNLFVKQFVSRCLLVYWWTWTVLAVGSAGSSTSAAFATVSTSVFTISNSFVGLILPPLGEAKYCDDRVCLSVYPRAYLRNYTSYLHQILCMLPTSVARSFCGGVAIRYVLPVLWVMPYLPKLAVCGGQCNTKTASQPAWWCIH